MEDLIMKYVSNLPGAKTLPNQGNLEQRLARVNNEFDFMVRWAINGERQGRKLHQQYGIIESLDVTAPNTD